MDYVDLGASYAINRVKIVWENAKGKDYQIQVTNDTSNWGNAVKSVTGNNALVNDHTDILATGRYVRLYGTARTTGYGYSIYELEVYGTAGARAGSFTNALVVENSTLFPNPVSETLTLRAVFSNDGIVNATVTDINGSAVLTKEFESHGNFEETINLAGLPAGVYAVKLSSGSESSVLRFVKQ